MRERCFLIGGVSIFGGSAIRLLDLHLRVALLKVGGVIGKPTAKGSDYVSLKVLLSAGIENKDRLGGSEGGGGKGGGSVTFSMA